MNILSFTERFYFGKIFERNLLKPHERNEWRLGSPLSDDAPHDSSMTIYNLHFTKIKAERREEKEYDTK